MLKVTIDSILHPSEYYADDTVPQSLALMLADMNLGPNDSVPLDALAAASFLTPGQVLKAASRSQPTQNEVLAAAAVAMLAARRVQGFAGSFIPDIMKALQAADVWFIDRTRENALDVEKALEALKSVHKVAGEACRNIPQPPPPPQQASPQNRWAPSRCSGPAPLPRDQMEFARRKCTASAAYDAVVAAERAVEVIMTWAGATLCNEVDEAAPTILTYAAYTLTYSFSACMNAAAAAGEEELWPSSRGGYKMTEGMRTAYNKEILRQREDLVRMLDIKSA